LALLIALLAPACAAEQPNNADQAAKAVGSEPAASPGECQVTMGTTGPPQVPERVMFGWSSSHGDERLLVGGLPPDGVIKPAPEQIQQDGSVSTKFGWWRGAPGELRITGRRLDGTAPPLRAELPDGYGEQGFKPSGVYFPTEGCWEVTGTLGDTRLTFVTKVVKET
jgi:hypothetical protein